MKNDRKKRLVLLDSHALLHRSYHAMGGFATHDGRPTGAIFGFLKMLLKIKEELKPNYVIATFDRKEATFRHEAYENYKAHRKASDEDLISQIEAAPRVCAALNIPVYSLAGFEADDLLGTICTELKKDNFQIQNKNLAKKSSESLELEIFIASGDMDTMQLIDPENHIQVYTLKKGLGETIIYKYQDVIKRWGFRPEQITDYKGLCGDSSDNIIGIKNIGAKTATTLINLFENLENMYNILHADKNEFVQICQAKKENKITERIMKLVEEGEDDAIFSKTLATIRCDAPINFQLPETEWLENFQDAEYKKICEEFELRTLKDKFSATNSAGQNSGSPSQNNLLRQTEEKNLSDKEKQEERKELQDLKVMVNLLDSEITNPDLATILDFADTQDLKKAKNILEEKLKNENLFSLYQQVEKPIEKILEKMKEFGIKVDKNILLEQSQVLHKKIQELEEKIYELAGEKFNIDSPKQIGTILYEKLQLGKKIKKTPGGVLSTGASELAKIKDSHPIVNLILEYREISKLTSTYVDSLPNFIEKDGHIHPDFIQSGAATGRFACENPNLQNLPAKSEIGLLVRKAFLSEPGFKLMSLDYSQIDLRSAVILSGDENLLEIFSTNTDVHTGVAAKVFKVNLEEVTKEMRRKAKVINFGILYGMGVTALKDSMQVERAEAQIFFDEYKKTFSTLMQYLEQVKLQAYQKNYTETLLGRRRQIPLLKSKLPFLLAQGERMAINAPIQGTTADILKLAMIDLNEYLIKNNLENKIKIILQIHDELILEIPENLVEIESLIFQNIFENVLQKRISDQNLNKIFLAKNFIEKVPLVVNIKVGKNLFEIK